MKDKSIYLLKQLTEVSGIPGAEYNVAKLFKDSVNANIIQDRVGSVFTNQKGSCEGPRVMIAGHFDEVGFVVQSITNEGYIKFISLGGVWAHVVLGQRVSILTDSGNSIPGVVAAKSPHFLTKQDLESLIPVNQMYIDVGAQSKHEVVDLYGIELGQPIVFDSKFIQLQNKDLLLSKAFDNRVGVALAIEASQCLAELNHPNIIFCGASVQEEVGARGGVTSVNLINPDVAIVLEGTPADDYPGSDKFSQQGVLGRGVQIRLLDPTAILSRKFNKFIIDVAKEFDIPYQVAVRDNGGTDAKHINIHNIGVPTVVLGVPVRYTHTANSIMDINDYLHTLKLIVEVSKRLDSSIVNSFINW